MQKVAVHQTVVNADRQVSVWVFTNILEAVSHTGNTLNTTVKSRNEHLCRVWKRPLIFYRGVAEAGAPEDTTVPRQRKSSMFKPTFPHK